MDSLWYLRPPMSLMLPNRVHKYQNYVQFRLKLAIKRYEL